MAGSVAALAAGANRVNITNGSATPAGILVSGTGQVVGNIGGTGNTQVNAGSSLTANHIIQNALVIGGTSTSHGTVTIDASDASGNPLIGVADPQLGERGSIASSFTAFPASVNFDSVAGSVPNSASLPLGSAVPEPPALLLLALAGLGAISRRRILR